MGIGVLTLPFYVSQLGFTGGLFAIILTGLLTLLKMNLIFEASESSNEI